MHQHKITYEPPGDVFNVTDFYYEDREIQLRTTGLRVFRAKAGTPLYDELEKIILAISPDRIRAFNWVNPIGSHYELIINFPKQSQLPLEEIHDPLPLAADAEPQAGSESGPEPEPQQ